MQKKTILFPGILFLIFLGCASGLKPLSGDPQYIDLDAGIENSVREKLIVEIKKFYGAPYRWGGSTPEGTDCSGMVQTIFKNAASINLPHNADLIFKGTKKIPTRDLMLGDLVFFSMDGSARATHMGVYIKNGYFIHASSSKGVILSKLGDRYYKRQFIGATRVE